MDKDPAASIPSPALLLAPLPTAEPEWMEQNPQAGTCSSSSWRAHLASPPGLGCLGLGIGLLWGITASTRVATPQGE